MQRIYNSVMNHPSVECEYSRQFFFGICGAVDATDAIQARASWFTSDEKI